MRHTTGMKQLALMQGKEIVKRYTLDKPIYTMGRSKDSDLVLDHPKVSRNHARLYSENGQYIVQDLNSTNYIFVNGVRVKQKKLEPNDRLQVSSDILLIYLENESPSIRDKSRTLMDVQKHFIHKDDLSRLKKVTQSVVLLNSLDTILTQILKEGISLTSAERGLIVLTDPEGKILWKYATTYRIDRDKAELGEADISQSILQEALDSRSTVVRFNDSKDSKNMPEPSESMMSLKIYSTMCAPLILNERLIGLFYVDARQLMNNFTEVDQFLFAYLADHAAIAIYNAKKFNDLQAETQHLRTSLSELEKTHQSLEERHQGLLSQMGQPTKEVKQISSQDARVLSEPISHTYSAGGVVINPDGHVLLVNQHGTSWSLPKGHIEVGEEPAITAQREIFEEAGISYLHLVQSLGSYQRSSLNRQGVEDSEEMKTIYMYLFATEQMHLVPQDEQNPEACWSSLEDAQKILTHSKDRVFLLKSRPAIAKAISIMAEQAVDDAESQTLEEGDQPKMPKNISEASEAP